MPGSTNPVERALRFFRRPVPIAGNWSGLSHQLRDWEQVYRQRWQHDKRVRSTHGVNCTGSCSWQIYVKDGIITWETQATDYPSNGPNAPDYEPRGCPRGATSSWYTYSPLRVKYPYVRGVLMELWREALSSHSDPVAAWASIVEDPDRAARYKRARGKGGLVRATWDQVNTIIAASLNYTIRKYGPDRVAGFSPIPAMSMVSYAAGSRFLSLIGGTILSFYDFYADLPPASPQIWGDQTDVPESADWYNSTYMILWGSNLPMTRTPDAHFMVENRYRGAKIAAVSPDYAEYVKFADTWLPAQVGTDGALAMAMTHVILKEFYADRQEPYFRDYARQYTDLPCLVLLRRDGDRFVSDRFLNAADLGRETGKAEWKTAVFDQISGGPAVPQGSIGCRWEQEGKWNLELKDVISGAEIDPALTLLGRQDDVAQVAFPYFGAGKGELVERGVPVKRLTGAAGEELWVTTVQDLLLAEVGVDRGLPGDYPHSYEEMGAYTPAWQEPITGVKAAEVIRVAREFAQNAAKTRGKSMIVMGGGINHWYHSDMTYRAILNLVLLTGAQGVNGGGWAHYVGQEKVRPITGWSTLAFAGDWGVPSRRQAATPFWYLASDQWRYEDFTGGEIASPLAGRFRDLHFADYNAVATRLGWLPSYPQFDQNPLDVCDQAVAAGAKDGAEVVSRTVSRLKDGDLTFAATDPDDPKNFPRVLLLWRSNLLGSAAKGNEYFLKHLLGTSHGVRRGEGKAKTQEVRWREEAPEGKLDLLVDLEFRLSDSALYSDIVLPAATWYEKHDLSSTDMHPFVHPFNPAIASPWEARSDWEIFKGLAREFSRLAEDHLGVRRDLMTLPLLHDSPDELAAPGGRVRDWKKGEVEAVPGVTMPKFLVVERDYPKVYEKMIAMGPGPRDKGLATKGIGWRAADEFEGLKERLGTVKSGVAQGNPSLERAEQVADAILALSGTTNGEMAARGWEALEKQTGRPLLDLAAGRRDERMTLKDLNAQPRKVITSPEWSGIESHDRRYSPFTVNVERLVPWRTLTGRQQFYVDHEWMLEFGEGLPLYRPPLDLLRLEGEPGAGGAAGSAANSLSVTLRYLTPHSKWSIHSTFGDTPHMLALFRGGPTIWLNNADAAQAGIGDNDWIECFNNHGAVVARAVVSHRLPRGVAFMYHAQQRSIGAPLSPATGERGGSHNSPTRIHMKPTHMIGGYAQLSWGFNYYGPTGSQRDEMTIVRKLGECCRIKLKERVSRVVRRFSRRSLPESGTETVF
ncbi:MAG: nitrate reductase subunit alpha, partial [Symbiobacteriia bacterium]